MTTTFEFVPLMDNGSAVRSTQLLYAQPLTGFDEQWVEIIEAGDLVLSDPCCDGFVYEWRWRSKYYTCATREACGRSVGRRTPGGYVLFVERRVSVRL